MRHWPRDPRRETPPRPARPHLEFHFELESCAPAQSPVRPALRGEVVNLRTAADVLPTPRKRAAWARGVL